MLIIRRLYRHSFGDMILPVRQNNTEGAHNRYSLSNVNVSVVKL